MGQRGRNFESPFETGRHGDDEEKIPQPHSFNLDRPTPPKKKKISLPTQTKAPHRVRGPRRLRRDEAQRPHRGLPRRRRERLGGPFRPGPAGRGSPFLRRRGFEKIAAVAAEEEEDQPLTLPISSSCALPPARRQGHGHVQDAPFALAVPGPQGRRGARRRPGSDLARVQLQGEKQKRRRRRGRGRFSLRGAPAVSGHRRGVQGRRVCCWEAADGERGGRRGCCRGCCCRGCCCCCKSCCCKSCCHSRSCACSSAKKALLAPRGPRCQQQPAQASVDGEAGSSINSSSCQRTRGRKRPRSSLQAAAAALLLRRRRRRRSSSSSFRLRSLIL